MGTITSLKKLPKSSNGIKDPEEGSFQAVVEGLEDPSKQIAYLMLGACEAIPGFSVRKTHPYSYFFYKKKGYKQVFQANKNMIVQEIKRRQPDAKPNQNNRSNEELMEMLVERWPLNTRDKTYVVDTETEYRKVLLGALNPKDILHVDELAQMAAAASTPSSTAAIPPGANRKRPAEECIDSSNPSSRRMVSDSIPGTYASISGGTSGASSSSAAAEQDLGALIGRLASSNVINVLEKLKKERFELTVKKETQLSKSRDANQIELIEKRIEEINESINLYEEKEQVVHL